MGFIVKAVKKVVGAVTKVLNKVLGPILGSKKSKKTASTTSLTKTLEINAERKIVFGKCASALDLRFWQVWGSDGTKYDEVIACASHTINAYKELYLENYLAVDANGVVQSRYSGALTRNTNLGTVGQAALVIGDGTQWTNTSTFTGVAHMGLRWNVTQKTMPNGVPSRYTQIIEGALVYDPRRDSTVPGGSGSHRINDQTTWAYSTLDPYGQPIGRNNALQVLWYLLGWYVPNVQTGELILVCGRGVDPNDINLASFIQAANDCEVAGYYTDTVLSMGDGHTDNEAKLTSNGVMGELIDTGGQWNYYANVNDTASISLYITDDDILDEGSVTWNEYGSITDQYQRVTGKFTDPSLLSLFQQNGYPQVRDTNYENLTGLKRTKTQDFIAVTDVLLAQKLARLYLNMGQYQGEFSANFSYSALQAQVYSIVSYTSDRFGWTRLFRVVNYNITQDEGVIMTLRQVDASIWSAGSVKQPDPVSVGTPYNPYAQVVATGITYQAITVTSAAGYAQDGVLFGWDVPPGNVDYTEVRFKLAGADYWQTASPNKGDNFVKVAPINSGSNYVFQVRHVSIHQIAGPWEPPDPGLAFIGGTSSTAPWEAVSDPNGTKPEDNATKGAPAGTPVGDRNAEDVTHGLDLNAQNIIQQYLTIDQQTQLIDARTLLSGQTIGTVVLANQQSQVDGDKAIVSTLNLIGAKSGDSQSFVMNLSTVQDSNGQSLAGRFDTITAQVGNQQATINNIAQTVAGIDGRTTALVVLELDVNGNISGFRATNDGTRSDFDILANKFSIVDPNGGNPFTPFIYENGLLKMTNVQVDTLAAGAVTIAGIQAGLSSVTTFTANDVLIPATETTIIETSATAIGDAVYGSAIATISFVHDSLSIRDTFVRFRTYIDIGDGNGYVLKRDRTQGIQTASGNTYWAMPVSYPVVIVAQNPIKIKLTGMGVQVNGGGTTNGSYARNIEIDVLKIAR